MKNRFLWFLLCGALTGVMCAVFQTRRPQPGLTPPSDPAPPATAEAESVMANPPASGPEAGALPAYRWRTGDHASWQLGVSLRMARTPAAIAQSPETRLGGTLHLVVLGQDFGQVRLAAALTESYFAANGERIGAVEQLLNSTPALLTLAPSGKLLALALPRQLPAPDRDMLRLAYGWEFVARDVRTYQEEEQAPYSAARPAPAIYRRIDGMRIQKSRLLPAPSGSLQNTITSQFTGTVGRLWIAELGGWEDNLITLKGQVSSMSRIVVSFKENPEAREILANLAALLNDPGARSAFTVAPGPAEEQWPAVTQGLPREVLAARWAGVPLNQILEQNIAEDPEQSLENLRHWLAACGSDGVPLALEALQRLQAGDGAASELLLNGMIETAPAAACAVLGTILNDAGSYTPTVVRQALVAASETGGVGEGPLRQVLLQFMDLPATDDPSRLSEAAWLSFARLARNDAAAQDLLRHRVARWLQEGAASASMAMAFDVLANAAVNTPDLLARATQLAQSADEHLRSAAEEYLEGLTNPQDSDLELEIDE